MNGTDNNSLSTGIREIKPVNAEIKSSVHWKWQHLKLNSRFTSDASFIYLGCLKNKIMDDDLLFVRETQPVFADKRHSKGLTVHGFFSTWPVYKLVFCLKTCKSNRRLIYFFAFNKDNIQRIKTWFNRQYNKPFKKVSI